MDERRYPGASEAHIEIAKRYSSPLLMGPPMNEDLVALVRHMYTEEEAELVRHLKAFRPSTARGLALRAGVPAGEAKRIMAVVAHEKYLVGFFGEGDRERFVLLPIVPGTFELVLMRDSADTVTPWHRRFAELFEKIFSTGYITDYFEGSSPYHSVRYIPVGEAVPAIPSALPSERLEGLLERYDRFAIGVCQCRLSKQLVGEGCGRMLETCTGFGDAVPLLVREHKMKQASMQDVIDVKREAESQGMVTWMFNVDYDSRFNGSCSCCGCCCGALRSVTEFDAPGFISPPRYVPDIDRAACNCCGACQEACPMGAMVVEGEAEAAELIHRGERCIGCGLCVVSCKRGALAMKEGEGRFKLPRNWTSFALKAAPSQLRTMLGVRRARRG